MDLKRTSSKINLEKLSFNVPIIKVLKKRRKLDEIYNERKRFTRTTFKTLIR